VYKYRITISDGHCSNTHDFISESGIYSIKDLFDGLVYGTDLHLPSVFAAPVQVIDSPATPSNKPCCPLLEHDIGKRWKCVNTRNADVEVYTE
jgi:hypothetical protein